MPNPIVFFDIAAEGPGGSESLGRIEMEVRAWRARAGGAPRPSPTAGAR
jgi:hypothetical protein